MLGAEPSWAISETYTSAGRSVRPASTACSGVVPVSAWPGSPTVPPSRAICGIVLPYRRRDLFEASGFNKRIGGIPVLTLVGALSLVGFLGAIAILLSDEASGTSLSANPGIVLITLGVFAIVGPAIYALSWFVRRRQGVDLGLVYREIPPE